VDPKWWTEVTLPDLQQARLVLAAFTDENAERPENFDQIVRAFCIKVLLEGQDAARQFVTELENINRAKLKFVHDDPFAPEHQRWFLKIGTIVTVLKDSLPLLPARYHAAIRQMHDTLGDEYQEFCGTRNVLQLRAKYFLPNGRAAPPKNK
jgi:hypothetical protein